jgi:hypothetical protein
VTPAAPAYSHGVKDVPGPSRLIAEAGRAPARRWFAQHAVGLATLALGVIAFVVVTAQQEQVWAQPDWRITVPFLVATVALGVVSLARREGATYLPLLGIGLAAAATVLGFAIIFGAIVLVTALIVVILSGVM